MCLEGEGDSTGYPVINICLDARRRVYAGGRSVYKWEARECGRPTTRFNIDMDGGQDRRPHCVYKGSPTQREALVKKVTMHGGRSMPEAMF